MTATSLPPPVETVASGQKPAAKQADPTSAWPCCWDGCTSAATHAITFHGQHGHVHDCGPHTAVLREWSDVATVVPLLRLPCPYPHGDTTWTDTPTDLEP